MKGIILWLREEVHTNLHPAKCPIPISMKLCGFVERAKIKDTYFCLAVVIQVLETLIEIDVGGFTNVFLASVHLPFKPRTELEVLQQLYALSRLK